MKTAVSIPDDVFEDAERLASRLQISRSKLYARALAEFVARHDDDRVTALMDQAVREAGREGDLFLPAAARQAAERELHLAVDTPPKHGRRDLMTRLR